MKNFLLDASAVTAACFKDENISSIKEFQDALRLKGGSQWLYMGELSSILDQLFSAREEFGHGHGLTDLNAPGFFDELSRDYQWLASLSGDIIDLDDKDPIAVGLVSAAARFGETAVVVTVEKDRLNRGYPFVDFAEALNKIDRTSIDFIDLKAQQDRIRPHLENALHTVLHHGQYIMGPEVGELEERLAQFVNVEHAIGVSNGTDAPLIAMMAIGIGFGDEVITSPLTVAYLRLIPALVLLRGNSAIWLINLSKRHGNFIGITFLVGYNGGEYSGY